MNILLSWIISTFVTSLFALFSLVQGMFDPAGISPTLLGEALEIWLVLFVLLFFLFKDLEDQFKRMNRDPRKRRRFDERF